MRITKEKPLELNKLDVFKNVRSDLADQVEKYWVGRTDSNIGCQFLSFKDGLVHKYGETSDAFARKDIFLVQLFGVFNAFVEVDGRVDIQEYGGTLEADEKEEVRSWVMNVLMVKEKDYVEHERRFLESKPWRQCDGMTPEQAVTRLRSLGW